MTTLILAALTMNIQTADIRLLRQPSVFGDEVAFVHGGDIWKCSLNGGPATRLTTFVNDEGRPTFSPDGKWIAFTGSYDGPPNVYIIPSDGGEPKRLTYGPGPDIVASWTADGKIAYSTTEQNIDPQRAIPSLWMVSPNGGMPERTSVGEFSAGNFSKDGNWVAYNRNNSFGYNWRRYRGGTQGWVSITNLKTNEYSEIPHGRENNWLPMVVGDDIYYVSDKVAGTLNLYRYSTKSKAIAQLTNFSDADIKMPSTDGKTIVFERDGILSAYDIASKAIKKIQPTVISDGSSYRPRLRRFGDMLSGVALSPSGKRVLIEARGEIFSVPAKNGETRNLTNSPASREKDPGWSPDGKSVAYFSDASGEFDLMIQPQMGGAPTKLLSGAQYKINGYNFSPDSKYISFGVLSGDMYIIEIATKKVTKVYSDPLGAGNYDWSADSSYIAFVKGGKNLQGSVWMYRVRDGKTTQVLSDYYSNGSVAFDLNGKYLYVVSNRNWEPSQNAYGLEVAIQNPARVYAISLTKDATNPFSPSDDEEGGAPGGAGKPGGATASGDDDEGEQLLAATQKAPEKKDAPAELKVDFDGIEKRLIALPHQPAANYVVIGANNGVMTFSPGAGLQKFDFGSKQVMDVLNGFQRLNLNAAHDKLVYTAGPNVFIAPAGPGIQPGSGKVNLDNVEAVWDPRAEWKQIFNEAWRYERDHFYDPNYTGVDWNAVKREYEAMLPWVSTRSELNYVLGLMIGELGTGHAYVGGGETGQRPPIPVGQLGCDYSVEGGNVRFKKIYIGDGFEAGNRGPLAEPGMNISEGDYLLEIDGKKVGGSVYPSQLLQNKVGKSVTIVVNSKPTLAGSRKVTVHPIGGESDIRYADWVDANRKKVEQLSGGKIGYLHVENTSEPGMIGFAKGYFSQSDKDAMIIDDRFNSGGNIPTYFYDKILRKYTSFMRPRNGVDIGFPTQTMEGPMAMLVNEHAGSGGDMFPWLFRHHKVGPLIGKRTWGGLVGITGSAPLIDGGFLSAPEFGIYDQRTGEWMIENNGIAPDVEIDMSPLDIAMGRDPQLEKAVNVLLDQLKKNPKKPNKVPDFPKIKKG